MASSLPQTPQVKTHRLKVWKTSCNSGTHFVYFNSWQLVDGLTSVMNHGHHSWAYPEGLTKFWGSSVYSSPPYSLYCTLKTLTFDLKPLLHPILAPPVPSLSSVRTAAACVDGGGVDGGVVVAREEEEEDFAQFCGVLNSARISFSL